jgi:hypothetical protein
VGKKEVGVVVANVEQFAIKVDNGKAKGSEHKDILSPQQSKAKIDLREARRELHRAMKPYRPHFPRG